jgi:DNA polymerase-3 subunit delta
MAVLKPAQIDQFIRSRDPALKAILVFGPDTGRVRETAVRLVESVAGSRDDPFNVVHLEDDVLSKDPALLSDEAQSISLMGGGRVVWVRSAANGFFGAAKSYLEHACGDALIVAEAGNLRKGTGLRALFEKQRNTGALACYEDSIRDIHGLIDEELAKYNLKISQESRVTLASFLGGDRALSRSELEKLALYCRGQGQVELADVEAICGDSSALTLDDMLDAIFSGDLTVADARYDRLVQSGVAVASVITAASGHVLRLRRMALETESGRNARQVVDAVRPPVFWKRKDSFVRQLTIWGSADLESAALTLAQAELQTREFAALSTSIANRALISLSRRAQSMQSR